MNRNKETLARRTRVRSILTTYQRPIELTGYLYKIPEIQELNKINSFLAKLISELQKPEKKYYRIPKESVKNLVNIIVETKMYKRINGFNDFNKDPLIFWDLIEYAQKHCVSRKSEQNIGVEAICFVYKCLTHANVFNDEYINHPKSVFYICADTKFKNLLCNPRMTVNKYFQVHFGACANPKPVFYDCKSEYLFNREYITNTRHRIDYGAPGYAYRVCCSFEENFTHPESIKNYKDFTVNLLTETINNIIKRYPDKEENPKYRYLRLLNIKFLLNIWSDLILDYTDFNFFEGSTLWSAETVLDEQTAVALTDGFKPVLCQLLNDVPHYDKILFIIHRTNDRVANGNGYAQHAVDMTEIHDLKYRRIGIEYMNYRLCMAVRNESQFKKMYKNYIYPVKKETNDMYHFSYQDLKRIYGLVMKTNKSPATKANLYTRIKAFLRWAEKNEHITIEKYALSRIKTLPQCRKINPHAVPLEEIEKIDDALLQLSEKNPRYLLSHCVLNIQLNSTSRPGEILRMRLDDITVTKDGDCIVETMSKNNYHTKRKQIYSREATQYILKAIDLTRELRKTLPECETKKCLFIYENKISLKKICVFTIMRYTDDLKKASELAGVEKITSGNIRDTSITAMRKFIRKENLSHKQAKALMGHMSVVSANHYDDIDFRDILEATENVILGTIKK